MKKKTLVMALALTFSIGLGATAYAATGAPQTNSKHATFQGFEKGKSHGLKGENPMVNLLKNKFGITDADLEAGKAAKKSIFDIAKDKGITEDQMKAAMLEQRTAFIDEAVKNGKMTQAQGDALKEKMKTNSENCKIPGDMKNNMKDNMKDKMKDNMKNHKKTGQKKGQKKDQIKTETEKQNNSGL